MILIAHRGNYKGREVEKENSLLHLHDAISRGYDVEVDVWKIDSEYFLGHDGPDINVSLFDLVELQDYAWFHAKNFEALTACMDLGLHVFFHDKDEYTVTSKGIIWAYSGKFVNSRGVACMPESTPGFIIPKFAYGVCSDSLEHLT